MSKIDDVDESREEQKQAILDARAESLSQTSLAERLQIRHIDVLEFVLSGERFAVEAKMVKEANKLKHVTSLPGAPDFILGLLNFRGQILPLLDLRKILELAPASQRNELQIMVVESRACQLGLAVDEITGILSIPEDEIQSAAQIASPSLAPLLKGIRCDRLAILDIEALLADPRLVVKGNLT